MSNVSVRALVEIFLGILALTVGTVTSLYLALLNQEFTSTNVELLLLIIVFGVLLTLGGALRRRGDTRRAAQTTEQ